MVRFWIVVSLSLVFARFAAAEERYALLIANEIYAGECSEIDDSNNPPLCNLNSPSDDVERIRQALLQASFPEENIIVLRDVGRVDTNRALREFSARLEEAGANGVGFFYYSGHGASAELAEGEGRENFLIPSGEPIRWAEDLEDYAIPVGRQVNRLSRSGGGTIFVVIDACRNTLRPNPKGTKGSAGLKGLRAVDVPSAVFVVFATEDGFFADDDSIFSQALAEELARPGQTAIEAFGNVSTKVARLKGDPRKFPVLKPHAGRSFCFVSCDAEGDELDWTFAKRLGSKQAYELYLERRPSGKFAGRAREALKGLENAPREAAPRTGGFALARGRGDNAFFAGDYETAREEYGLACRLGIGEACAALAVMFEQGLGGEQDLASARTSYETACADELAGACARLSQMQFYGMGGPVNLSSALENASTACELGDQNGCNTALLISFGPGQVDGPVEDYQICEAGDAVACRELGDRLLSQSAVDPNNAVLARLAFGEACGLGDQMGCAVYGALLYEGLGGEVDTEFGLLLVRDGCDSGVEEACAYLAVNDLEP